jgi:non-specific serine/threonine protein kinase
MNVGHEQETIGQPPEPRSGSGSGSGSGPGARATVVADTIPRQIGQYPVERELGRGGMGIVYLSRDPTLGRQVAIKVLPSGFTSDERRLRFEREARTAAQLNHPSIATVYELGQAEDTYFIAMEYVDGKSLRESLLGPEPLSLGEALEIGIQTAEALAAAHGRNIVHRDLKPHNVMLTDQGRVKILDFGLAKMLTPLSTEEGVSVPPTVTLLTAEHRVLGTPGYMSPEQVRGEQVDARSDIFSFGVVLYEMVTGEMPFTGESDADILSAILRDTPLPVRNRNPMVPAELDRLIGRCLEKDCGARFQSTRELVTDLHRIKQSGCCDSVSDEKPSVAVLPFENMSADPENEYFTDGMAGEILNALSKVKALRVASRTSSFAFKGKHEDIRKIGQELDVQNLLEGSVQKSGKRLRISAQLVNCNDGYQLWSERYDRDVEDIFAIQDEIAGSITKALQVVLTKKEKQAIEKAPTENVKAYDYYLRGRQFFEQFSRKGWEFAQPMFQRAIQIDPHYALAYAGIADCCSMLYMYLEASEANLNEADRTSRKALELDPDLAEAHLARGLALSLKGGFEEARDEFETAIRLNSRLYDAYYYYARTCFSNGRLEDATRLFEHAWEVRPEDYQAPSMLAMAYAGSGLPNKAQETNRRALDVIRKHLDLNPDDARAVYLGAAVLCKLGQREESLEWTGRALRMDPEDPWVLYNVACTYALQERPEAAIDCLEKAVEEGMGERRWFENDPDLNSLRNSPRFKALLERMSL